MLVGQQHERRLSSVVLSKQIHLAQQASTADSALKRFDYLDGLVEYELRLLLPRIKLSTTAAREQFMSLLRSDSRS